MYHKWRISYIAHNNIFYRTFMYRHTPIQPSDCTLTLTNTHKHVKQSTSFLSLIPLCHTSSKHTSIYNISLLSCGLHASLAYSTPLDCRRAPQIRHQRSCTGHAWRSMVSGVSPPRHANQVTTTTPAPGTMLVAVRHRYGVTASQRHSLHRDTIDFVASPPCQRHRWHLYNNHSIPTPCVSTPWHTHTTLMPCNAYKYTYIHSTHNSIA